MENLNTIKYQPVTTLTKLNEPHKVFDNKNTYLKSSNSEPNKITIYKTIDPARVEQKSGTAVTYDHYNQACADAKNKTQLDEIEPFPYFINLDFDNPSFAVFWHLDEEDTQTVHEFFYSGVGAHILDTLQDCLVALPSGWDYFDKPRPVH